MIREQEPEAQRRVQEVILQDPEQQLQDHPDRMTDPIIVHREVLQDRLHTEDHLRVQEAQECHQEVADVHLPEEITK